MDSQPRKISWIAAPPEICSLCKEPLGSPEETSSWNGRPAHRDCVRVHLLQQDPAFREGSGDEGTEDQEDVLDGGIARDDDEIDLE